MVHEIWSYSDYWVVIPSNKNSHDHHWWNRMHLCLFASSLCLTLDVRWLRQFWLLWQYLQLSHQSRRSRSNRKEVKESCQRRLCGVSLQTPLELHQSCSLQLLFLEHRIVFFTTFINRNLVWIARNATDTPLLVANSYGFSFDQHFCRMPFSVGDYRFINGKFCIKNNELGKVSV